MIPDPTACASARDFARACGAELGSLIAERGVEISGAELAEITEAFGELWEARIAKLAQEQPLDGQTSLAAWPQVLDDLPELNRLMFVTGTAWVRDRVTVIDALIRDKGELAQWGVNLADGISMLRDVTDTTAPMPVMKLVIARRLFFYKPRDLRSEIVFGELISRVGDGIGLRMRVVKYLPRGTYGWAEGVLPRPCENEKQVDSFYARMGLYLAVALAVGSFDLHGGNFIAAGKYPVLIDAESIMCSPIQVWSTQPAYQPGGPGLNLNDSLMLSRVTQTRTREAYPVSSARLTGALCPHPGAGCQPEFGDKSFPAYEHLPAILWGYRAASAWISGPGRDEVLRLIGKVDELPVRAMMRSFEQEDKALLAAWKPEHLVSWSARLRAIQQGLRLSDVLNGKAERAAMPTVESMMLVDLIHPRFTIAGNGTRVDRYGTAIERSATDRARDASLVAARTWRDQEILIHAALAPPRRIRMRAPDPDQLAQAAELQDWCELMTATVWGEQSLRYLGVHRDPDSHLPALVYTGSDFYAGAAGLGPALLVAAAALPQEAELAGETRELGLAFLGMLEKRALPVVRRGRAAIGVDVGGAGVALGFALAFDLTGQDRYLSMAKDSILGCLPVFDQHRYDLLGGTAGASTVALAVAARSGSSECFEVASQLLDHAMSQAEMSDDESTLRWKFRHRWDRGWAHGAAGMQYALAAGVNAGAVDGRGPEALAMLVRSQLRRLDDEPNRVTGLCDGIAGELLAAAMTAIAVPELRADSLEVVSRCLSAISERDPGMDTLCCGTAGVAASVQFLMDADSVATGVDDGWSRESILRLLEGADVSLSRPRLGYPHDVSRIAPGLWTGTAGPAALVTGTPGRRFLAAAATFGIASATSSY